MRTLLLLTMLFPAVALGQDDPTEEPMEDPIEVPDEIPVVEAPAVIEAQPVVEAPAVVAAPLVAGAVGVAIQAACASEAACGCGKPDCESIYAKSAHTGGVELFSCLAALDCAAKCDPKAGDPGTVAHATCVAPAIQRIEADAAAKAAESAAGHKAVMGVINNYPTGGVPKKRIYDQNGNFLREE